MSHSFSLKCPDPVVATVGEQATLSCQVQPQTEKDMSMDVIWSNVTVELHNQEGGYVHVFRNRADDPHSQHDQFKGRTQLDQEQLKKGNISLTIFNVSEKDAGNYSCSIQLYESDGVYKTKNFVKLEVRPKSIDEGQRDTKVTPETPATEGHNYVAIIASVGGVLLLIIIAGIVLVRKKGILQRRRDSSCDVDVSYRASYRTGRKVKFIRGRTAPRQSKSSQSGARATK